MTSSNHFKLPKNWQNYFGSSSSLFVSQMQNSNPPVEKEQPQGPVGLTRYMSNIETNPSTMSETPFWKAPELFPLDGMKY